MYIATFHQSLFLKRAFLFAVCGYLFCQGFFPHIERAIPWGEAFCFFLFFGSLKMVYTFNAQKKIVHAIYLWIFFVPFYGVWVTLHFWKEYYIPYYFWRSLVPFYYAIFFFCAYRWGPEILELLKRFKFIVLAIIFLFLAQTKYVGIGSSVVVGLVWLGILYKNESRRLFWFTYYLLLMVLFLFGEGGTGKIVNVMLILYPVVMLIIHGLSKFQLSGWQKILFRVFLFGVFLLIVFGAKLLLDDVHNFMKLGLTQMHFSLEGIKGESQFTDASALWRLFIWTYVLGQFWEFPQGIGLGTALLGNDLGIFFGWGIGDFEEMQFALGAHNSFITLLGRLGIVSLIFFFLIGKPLLQCVTRFGKMTKPLNKWDSEFCTVFGSLGVFLIAFAQAFFNMMIETPLYAAHFWFSLGLFVRLSGDYIARQRADNPVIS